MEGRYTKSKLYYTSRWKIVRNRQLREFPLCKMCEKIGKITPAIIVDHIIPHKGNSELFWKKSNLQSLCKLCHDSAKKIKENNGLYPGCDINGMPLDNEHYWNK